MELYIGGYAQGKLSYVKKKYPNSDLQIVDGAQADFETAEAAVYDHFHLWVKRKLEEGADVEHMTRQLVEKNPGCIIICDEIGNGIVPLEEAEREYRERTGRLLCELAKGADCVERIICGIGQRIK